MTASNPEQVRAEFEAWWASTFDRASVKHYAWAAWKAALASAPRAAEAVAPWGPPIGWLRVKPVLPGEPGWTVTWQTNRPAQQGDWQPLYQYEQFQHPSNTAKPYPAQAAAADAPPDLGQRSPMTDGPTPLSVPASVAEQKDAARWRKFCEAFDKPMQRAWLAKGFGCYPDEFEPSMNAVVDAAMGAAPKGPK